MHGVAAVLAGNPPTLLSLADPPGGSAHASHGGGHAGHAAPAPTGSASQDAGTPSTVYTCPMHPEVTSSEQGRCPKCGMKLVPQKPAGSKPSEGNGHSHQHEAHR
ncbi:hypothetical protein DAT35_45000 [Vitiosangium sp. GDMCC 1.1324]|nr:hypothetical protein DAT35_45000 [Vitiosangium sp. GDMCC 1.1324]